MKRLALVAVALSLGCATGWAQVTAQIHGTIQDSSDAGVPGAEIKATQIDTGVTRTTTSAADGGYLFTNLPIGPYRLEVSKDGFSKYTQSGVVLQVSSDPLIDVALKVGAVSEQVSVEANAAMVETRNSSVGEVIQSDRIVDLPLNGRQVTDLITLAGAAVQSTVTPGDRNGGGVFISVGGGLGYALEYNLDGADHRNFLSGAAFPMPFPDALQEFKVETTGLTVQRGSASSVNGVTKSGTNEIHGDAFEFLRNDKTSARPYFAVGQSSLKRNQVGGTIGGPIIKNKIFAFAGFQDTITRQDPASTQAFLPTQAMLNGNWTDFASPACNAGRTVALKGGFTGTQTSPALYDKASVNMLTKIYAGTPIPTNPCGLVTFGRLTVRDERQGVARVDYQKSDKQSIFTRYIATQIYSPNPFTLDTTNLLNTPAAGADSLVQTATIGDTYLFGPNTVNSFRAGYDRVSIIVAGNEFFSSCDLGVNFYCGYDPHRMGTTAISGGFTVGSTGGSPSRPNTYKGSIFQMNDDVSMVRGAHQFSFGANGLLQRYYQTNGFVDTGTWTFGSTVTGIGMGDFLLGKLTTLATGARGYYAIRQYSVAVYATDSWRVSPKLSVNYGVRWEPYIPQNIPNNYVYSFDLNRFNQGVESTVYANSPAGLYYPGDPGFPGNKGIYDKWAHFAPRVGVAWDPFGDGKTSIRGSYGFSYNFVSAQWRLDSAGSAPFQNRNTQSSPVGGFDDPWQGFAGGNPFPYVLDKNVRFTPYSNITSLSYGIKTPATSAWNLSIQHQFGKDWLASATYLGTETEHMWTFQALNPAQFLGTAATCTVGTITITNCNTTASTNQRRLFSLLRPQDGQYMGPVAQTDDGGTMGYNALLLSLQHRLTRGLAASVNYTLSHCIGDYADLNSVGPAADATYTNPNNRKADRGNCDTDRRHIFNLTASAEAPRFANRMTNRIVSGWKLAGIYRYSSGLPINITTGVDNALNGILLQRPNQILPDAYTGNTGPNAVMLNAGAFLAPTTGTVGNVGRNSIYGPTTWQLDMDLSRNFRVTERLGLQLRAEAFNVTNSFRAGANPVGAINSNTFGQVRTALDGRDMEFAVKLTF